MQTVPGAVDKADTALARGSTGTKCQSHTEKGNSTLSQTVQLSCRDVPASSSSLFHSHFCSRLGADDRAGLYIPVLYPAFSFKAVFFFFVDIVSLAWMLLLAKRWKCCTSECFKSRLNNQRLSCVNSGDDSVCLHPEVFVLSMYWLLGVSFKCSHIVMDQQSHTNYHRKITSNTQQDKRAVILQSYGISEALPLAWSNSRSSSRVITGLPFFSSGTPSTWKTLHRSCLEIPKAGRWLTYNMTSSSRTTSDTYFPVSA